MTISISSFWKQGYRNQLFTWKYLRRCWAQLRVRPRVRLVRCSTTPRPTTETWTTRQRPKSRCKADFCWLAISFFKGETQMIRLKVELSGKNNPETANRRTKLKWNNTLIYTFRFTYELFQLWNLFRLLNIENRLSNNVLWCDN